MFHHFSGMYGVNVKSFFDQSKAFSLKEICDQMDSPDNLFTNKKAADSDINFNNVGRHILGEKFNPYNRAFDEDVYYKCVGPEWKSHISRTPINYKLGDNDIISESEHQGIYVHTNPFDPIHVTDNWVALQLVSGSKRVDGKETVLYGNVRVIDNFEMPQVDVSKYILGFLK